MGIAKQAASRATCPRAQVGAVITVNNRIVATGYNGSPSGEPHCEDEGCVIHANHCIRTIHAEVNAIVNAVADLRGGKMYCTHLPCYECSKLILQVGIVEVWCDTLYMDDRSQQYGNPLIKNIRVYANNARIDELVDNTTDGV